MMAFLMIHIWVLKVDISRAFSHIRINLRVDLLGLQHRGKLFLDLSLPFGFHSGALFFSKVTTKLGS